MQFKFLNIPVTICPSFWMFLFFFTGIYQNPSEISLILGIVLTISLLVHEYGHALTAVYFGRSPEITLEAFGGHASYDGNGMTPRQRFFIVLNGPLFESVLIALSYFLLKTHVFESYYIRVFLYATMRLNILWVLFNLIPVIPLDGGYLLHYLLEKKIGERACILIGLASAIIGAAYFLYEGMYFFGGFLLISGYQQYTRLESVKKDTPFTLHMKGVEAIQKNELEEAKACFQTLIKKSEDSEMRVSATENLAKIYYQQDNRQLSYKLLMQADPGYLKEGKPLLCQLAYEQGNYELVGKYALDIYEIDPTQKTAFLNSRAFAHLKDATLSGGWLKTASQFEEGSSVEDLLADTSYDAVRDEEAFREQVKEVFPRLKL